MVTKKQNEEMIDVIEDKSIQKCVEEFYQLEQKLKDKLSKLPNYSKPCDCEDDTEFIKFIHEAEFDETYTICINCGGYEEV